MEKKMMKKKDIELTLSLSPGTEVISRQARAVHVTHLFKQQCKVEHYSWEMIIRQHVAGLFMKLTHALRLNAKSTGKRHI